MVATVVGVANNFGCGTFTIFPLGHHSEPFMPGDRTCNGGAYTFQIPGAPAVPGTVVIPMRVLAPDPDNQTSTAIFAKDHSVGATVRPTIWPTPILNEGDSRAFAVLAVASPDPAAISPR